MPVFAGEHFAVSAHLLLGAFGNNVSNWAQPSGAERRRRRSSVPGLTMRRSSSLSSEQMRPSKMEDEIGVNVATAIELRVSQPSELGSQPEENGESGAGVQP